ncbi:restriction endonuclease subunit S [Leptothoe kymatousa]|uniref:Restriction endonuclease subunit S n=1 Tax=Leptothoe kymatousa TAU-MAC 1615 TaxID=2364775 RepID=A0ABS5Y2L8_9CYAN|nr:restriction endonuclease subunit S [Leptothoe kymatousa]MBT9312041.1 restriction endonuclease subunit S [Leptothoe kymatousa TAU-MAC 1615]
MLQTVQMDLAKSQSWETVTLADLLTENPCNGLYKSSNFLGSGVLFLDINGLYKGLSADFSTARRINVDAKEFERYSLKISDILFNRVSKTPEGVGKAVMVDFLPEPSVFESNMIRVRLDLSRVDNLFLVYYLSSDKARKELLSKANLANQASINQQALKSLKIPLPPLSEQKRIARILDAADALRVKRREAISQLDALLQSTFLTLFGDPVSNPKCPVTNLDKHLIFVTSGGRGWAKYYSEKGKRFIRSLDVQMNGISNKEIILVDPPDNAEAKRTKVTKNDVLLTITGSRIGRVAKVPDYLEGSFISQHVAILRLDSHLMPDFLAHFLSLQQGGQIQIRKMQYGQTKPGLNFKQIRAFQIPIPSVKEQHHFADIVSSIEKQKAQQRIHLAELDTLFATLQSRAFKGEL